MTHLQSSSFLLRVDSAEFVSFELLLLVKVCPHCMMMSLILLPGRFRFVPGHDDRRDFILIRQLGECLQLIRRRLELRQRKGVGCLGARREKLLNPAAACRSVFCLQRLQLLVQERCIGRFELGAVGLQQFQYLRQLELGAGRFAHLPQGETLRHTVETSPGNPLDGCRQIGVGTALIDDFVV